MKAILSYLVIQEDRVKVKKKKNENTEMRTQICRGILLNNSKYEITNRTQKNTNWESLSIENKDHELLIWLQILYGYDDHWEFIIKRMEKNKNKQEICIRMHCPSNSSKIRQTNDSLAYLGLSSCSVEATHEIDYSFNFHLVSLVSSHLAPPLHKCKNINDFRCVVKIFQCIFDFYSHHFMKN